MSSQSVMCYRHWLHRKALRDLTANSGSIAVACHPILARALLGAGVQHQEAKLVYNCELCIVLVLVVRPAPLTPPDGANGPVHPPARQRALPDI